MENLYGNAFTNIPSTAGDYWPSDEIGGNVNAKGGILASAKLVLIKAVVVRVLNTGGTFTLEDHDGNVIAAFTPTQAGTISFGKEGILIRSGWSINQDATTPGGALMVVWKRIL